MPRGLGWRFHAWTKQGSLYLDGALTDGAYKEERPSGTSSATRIVGKHYEVDTTSGQVTKRYYAGDALLATKTGTTLTYVQGDHLGSTSTLTNGGGNVVGRERYSAFGERRRGESYLITDQLYTGQRLNVLSGLYHYSDGGSAGRFYDPLLARFLSPDKATPPGSQGLNAYSYTLNNPIRHSDPNGQFPWDVTIDVASWVLSANDFRTEPSLANAGWLALDTVSLLPAIPAVGALHHGAKLLGKVDEVAEFAAHYGDEVIEGLEAAARQVDDICSFSEDTVVATAEGQEAISALAVGDRVLSYDEAVGATGYYTITAVMRHVDPVVVHLTIDGERIETTPEHPFYTWGGQWVAAGDLAPGMRIQQASGGYGVVEAVVVVEQPQPMYNLTVAQAHTFFVGQKQWLVHNTCLQHQAAALQQAVGDTGRGNPSVALTEAGTKTHSGWTPRSGYSQVATQEMFDLGNDIGHDFQPHFRDRGVPGRYYASHAEAQAAALGGRAIGVSNTMCLECQRFVSRLAGFRGEAIVIADPQNVRTFHPLGIIEVEDISLYRP